MLSTVLAAGMSACTSSSSVATSATSTGSQATTESTTAARATPSIVPSGKTQACDVLAVDDLKAALGTSGQSMLAAEPSGVQLDGGRERDTCVYPLDASGVTTNAVIVEVLRSTNGTTPSIEEFGPVTGADDVAGLGERAQYSMVRLSGSSEFSLRVQSKTAAYRLVIARPNDVNAWDRDQGRRVVEQIMSKAKF